MTLQKNSILLGMIMIIIHQGGGSYGNVFLYQKKKTGKLIAIKKMGVFAKDRFEKAANEIEINKILDHPNIIKFLWLFYDKINYEIYIAMEWGSQGNLRQLIAKRRNKMEYFEEKKILYGSFKYVQD